MSFKSTFKEVDVDSITSDNDLFAMLRSGELPSSLVASIKDFGILFPLLVLKKRDHFTCLTGLNRLMVARQLGIQSVPCRVLEEELGWQKILALVYHYKKGNGLTSRVEDGCLLRFGRNLLNDKELLSLMDFMGYKRSMHVLKDIVATFSFPKAVLLSIHDGRVSEKLINKLKKLNSSDQKFLVKLIARYRFGFSKQQRLTDLTVELTKRHACSLQSIYDQWFEKTHVTDENNTPQQGAQLLDHLQSLYSPRLRMAEQEFQNKLRKFHLPDKVTVTHSQSFEHDNLTLQLKCSSFKELEDLMPAIIARISS